MANGVGPLRGGYGFPNQQRPPPNRVGPLRGGYGFPPQRPAGLLSQPEGEQPDTSGPSIGSDTYPYMGGDPSRGLQPSGFGSWLKSMLLNIPESGVQFGVDMAALLRPGTYKALFELTHNRDMQSKVFGHLGERYGGVDNIAETMRTDPVGILSDVAGIVTGGAGLVAKTSAKGGRIANVASTIRDVARKADPVTGLVGLAKAPIKYGPDVAASLITASGDTWRQAVRAGWEGGKASTEFKQMLNHMDYNGQLKIVEDMRKAMSRVRNERKRAYQTEMDKIGRADVEAIDMQPIRDAIAEAERRLYATDASGAPSALPGDPAFAKLEQVKQMVAQFEGPWAANAQDLKANKFQPARPATVHNVDDLKQAVGRLQLQGDKGNVGAAMVRDAIEEQIVQQAPTYADVMKGYREASNQIFQMEKELMLGGTKISDAQVFNRALSTTRDQVNTSFGGRKGVLDELDESIFNRLSGAALNPPMATGIRGGGGAVGSTMLGMEGLSSGNLPQVGAAMAMPVVGSPRVHGTVAHGMGAAARNVAQFPQNIPRIGPRAPTNLMEMGQRVAQNPYKVLDVTEATSRALRPIAEPLHEGVGPLKEGYGYPTSTPTATSGRDMTDEERAAAMQQIRAGMATLDSIR